MLCVLPLCAARRTWGAEKKKIKLPLNVDEPQAQLHWTISSRGYSSDRTSGQEGIIWITLPSDLHGWKEVAYCTVVTFWPVSFLYPISALLLILMALKGTTEREMLMLSLWTSFFFLTAVLLLVCMQPSSHTDIRFHYVVLQLDWYRFNQGSNLTIATNHKYILTSICISHMHNLSSENTEQRAIHLFAESSSKRDPWINHDYHGDTTGTSSVLLHQM